VYALVLGKNGSKLRPGAAGNPERIELDVSGTGFHHMIGQSVTGSTIAKVLFREAGRMVIDRACGEFRLPVGMGSGRGQHALNQRSEVRG